MSSVPISWKLKWARERVEACENMVWFHGRHGDAEAKQAAEYRLMTAKDVLADYQAQELEQRLSGEPAHG